MGACISSADPAAATASNEKAASITATTTAENTPQDQNVAEFMLKKRRPGCSGMFWREDPRTPKQVQLTGGYNWPKDNATLRGVTIEAEDEKWLHVHKVMQEGGKWLDAPDGAFIPFEYDDHYYLDPVKSG